ncbi:hypothetical protein ACI79C_23075 [Geodermatophilus sp. SYSU D00697]
MSRRAAGIWALVLAAAIAGCSDPGTTTSGSATSAAATSAAATSAAEASVSGASVSGAPGTAAAGAAASGAAVCQAADRLRSSLTALGDVQVLQQGTDAVRQAFTSVEDALGQLRQEAGTAYAGQVDQVQSDAAQVRTTLDAAQQDASARTLGDVASAVGVLLADARALLDDVGSTC